MNPLELLFLFLVISYFCGYIMGMEDHGGRMAVGLLWPFWLILHAVIVPVLSLWDDKGSK